MTFATPEHSHRPPHHERPTEGREEQEMTNNETMFETIEVAMINRKFLASNPVIERVEAREMSREQVVEVLRQYCRLPEEIVSILRAAASHFPRQAMVQRELARNIAEESGYGTGGVAHVEILKHMLQRDLGVDATAVEGSKETERFIAAIKDGMRKNASFALGQAFALEASAVPELSRIVGPAVNAAATLSEMDAPISADALQETGAYELPTIRTREEAMDMSADDWFALHIKDFEIGHRDNLRLFAEMFLAEAGDAAEFEAGFTRVMDLMDEWWTALAR